MPRKGVKLEKANFRILLLLLALVQLVYLTNSSTDKHETCWSCDLMNDVMFKSMSFLANNLEQYFIKGT